MAQNGDGLLPEQVVGKPNSSDTREHDDPEPAAAHDDVADLLDLVGGGAKALLDVATWLTGGGSSSADIAREAKVTSDQARTLEVGQQQLFDGPDADVSALTAVQNQTTVLAGHLAVISDRQGRQAELAERSETILGTLVAVATSQRDSAREAARAADEADRTSRRLAIVAICISVVGTVVAVVLQAMSLAVQLNWWP